MGTLAVTAPRGCSWLAGLFRARQMSSADMMKRCTARHVTGILYLIYGREMYTSCRVTSDWLATCRDPEFFTVNWARKQTCASSVNTASLTIRQTECTVAIQLYRSMRCLNEVPFKYFQLLRRPPFSRYIPVFFLITVSVIIIVYFFVSYRTSSNIERWIKTLNF